MLDSVVLETTPLIVTATVITVRAVVREAFWLGALAHPARLLRAVNREPLTLKERKQLLALLLAAHHDTVAARAKRDAARLAAGGGRRHVLYSRVVEPIR